MHTVSVIVPCYNEERTISLLLDALYAQTYPHEAMEVIFADGLSRDATTKVIEDWCASHEGMRVRIVENPKRIIPAALNLAIAAAQGEFVVRMDAHSIPAVDYVERCVAALTNNTADNVGGRWDIRPGGTGWQARSIAQAASSPLGVGDAKYRYSEEAAYVETVPFGSYRRTYLEQLGGFDESLLTNEDYDLNTRIAQSGGKIWFDPHIRCVYFARSSFVSLAKQYWRYGYWKVQMLRKAPGSLRLRQLIPPLFVASLLLMLLGSFFFDICATVLSLEIAVYVISLLFTGIRIAGRNDDLTMMAGVPIAIMVMHFCWGAGFIVGLLRKKTTGEKTPVIQRESGSGS